MNSPVVDDLERFAFEHFQPGVCLPGESGVRARAIVNAGRNFVPDAFDAFRNLAATSVWWRETTALKKSDTVVLGRVENVQEFKEMLKRKKELKDKSGLKELLRNLQAERLALEIEYAARAEELVRRD
jgi:hypothetical protein